MGKGGKGKGRGKGYEGDGEERADRAEKGDRGGGKGGKGKRKGKGGKDGGKEASRSDFDGDWRGDGRVAEPSHAEASVDRRIEVTQEAPAESPKKPDSNGGSKFGSQDVRYESPANLASQDVRYESQSQDVRYSSQDVRYATQDVRYATQDVRYETQDVRYANQDVRYEQAPEPKAKAKKKRGGGGEKGGGGGDKEGGKEGGGKSGGKKKKGGGKGKGSQKEKDVSPGDGEDLPEDWEEGGEEPDEQQDAPGKTRNKALNSKIRKLLQAYEESLSIEDLGNAYQILEDTVQAGEDACDTATATALLVALTRANKMQTAQKVIDILVAQKVFLDPAAVVSIVTAVSQRCQSHKALRYLRRLIYETLPEDFKQEQIQFFDKHVSFIFSELMAEADGCFGRMENRDPNALVNLGHAELDVQMDWSKSSGTSFLLYNRPEGGKNVYIPTVFGMGFQRTDSALISFDISNPAVQAEVSRDYDRLRDGAEVEVTMSATSPDKQAALTCRLTSPPKVPFRENMFYRLDRLASRDQTRRMLDALKVILKAPSGSSKKGQQGNAAASLQPHPTLRDLFLVPMDKTLKQFGKAELGREVMDFNGDTKRQAGLAAFMEESKHAYNHLLNKSQLEALTLATSLRLTLIQGPPGTGKTTTAVQIVSALVEYGLVDLPLLVTADSNTAVDNLVKGIGKRGLSVVRVGRPESIREDVKGYSLDGRWKDLKKAEVVCATCIGASGTTLDKVRFSTVLIDECTQAAESAALVPLARGCQQAILIGDQCQLPPTVLSDVAETENLGESLFTRLVTQGVRPVLLDTQYRMHPLIAEFASAAFYNGRLQNGVSHIHRQPPAGFPWPQRQMPVAFVNLDRGEEKREGSSYINPSEAEKTLWALLEVCKNDQLGPEEVGIVTPYKGQVNFIKKLIRERPGLQKFRSGLEVESVDGFQGQEKEVIIFCAVRNNREGKVGFLSDWRRLNVMLTRARRGCIVIGSKSTLNFDPLWHEWLIWATARGAICGESAKGTWQPKYLVDDRDGVWTIKAQLSEAPATASKATAAVSKEPEEILDSWEDMGSPLQSPVASPMVDKAGSLLDESAVAADDVKEEGPGPPKPEENGKVLTRAEEARKERLRLEVEAAEEMARLQIESSLGGLDTKKADESSSRGRPKPSRIGDDGDADDEIRKLGSPNAGPRSPQRVLAMAKLGLLEDADAEELAEK